MATGEKLRDKSRFTDIIDEPVDHLLCPIKGYDDKPLVSLGEAIKPVSEKFEEIEDYVFVALHNCRNPTDGLTIDESASIHLYTMEFGTDPSFYKLFNESLRSESRDTLKPWFSFLKLFLTGLYKLPSIQKTVWRGIKNVDLSSKYKKGTKFAWWGVSSCTSDIQILESSEFLGKEGERTLFSIECINGKSVASHSYFKNTEKEIILMPGSYFEVIGQINPAPKLHIIQLQELIPPVNLIKPPFTELPVEKTEKGCKSSIATTDKLCFDTKLNVCGTIVAGGNGAGDNLNQLSHPYGICVDDRQAICITDWWNHRILEWKLNAVNGQIIAGGRKKGNQPNQLNDPTDVIIDKTSGSCIIADTRNKRVVRWSRRGNINGQVIISNIDCYGLAMDHDGYLYVSNWNKDEVRRWKIGDKMGTIVAGGNRKGNHLNQFDRPTYIFVDRDYSVYVSDCENHRVMKWIKGATQGIIVAGGHDAGVNLKHLSFPRGLFVDEMDQIYVVDCNNHRVTRWSRDAKEGTLVAGGNGRGEALNQLDHPRGLAFDRQGNMYVVDWGNHRVMKFEVDAS